MSSTFAMRIEDEIHRRMSAVTGLKKGLNFVEGVGLGSNNLVFGTKRDHYIYLTVSWKIARELN